VMQDRKSEDFSSFKKRVESTADVEEAEEGHAADDGEVSS